MIQCLYLAHGVVQVAEYNRLKAKAGKKSASLTQQLERVSVAAIHISTHVHVHTVYIYLHVHICTQGKLELRTDEEALQQSEMKKQELLNRKQQLEEQRCTACTQLLSSTMNTSLCYLYTCM